MPVEVPVASLNAQSSQTVSLDTIVYRITFTFNTRCRAWDLSIAEQNGNEIVSGIKLLPGIDLLDRHKDSRLPPGLLWAVDVQEGADALRPGRTQLGSKLRLVYVTKAEKDALISA